MYTYLQLSVIIVNYNVKYFLEQCLSSLFKAITSVDAEVWVIDNASADGSIEYLNQRFPSVHFISNEQNVGFGKANNQALFQCKGKHVLFLNPDTILPEDCLTNCLAFMNENAQAGALGIRMIDGSGTFLPESKRSFPSPLTSFYKVAGLNKLFPASKIFSRYSLGYLDQFKNHEVDVLAGAFFFSRKDILVKLRGFDEAFFMYGEDIDLSYQIQKAGYKNYYFGESTIIHFKGESTSKGSLNYVKMFYTAMSIFVKKHYSGTSAGVFAFFIQIAIWFGAGISIAARVISGKRKKINRALKTSIQKQRKTVIAGTEEEYAEVMSLLKHAGLEETIAGRLAVSDDITNAIGSIAEIENFIKNSQYKEIIFCSGYVSNKAVIETIQKLPDTISIRFHATGTQSIVGSDSKNTAGEFVAAKAEG